MRILLRVFFCLFQNPYRTLAAAEQDVKAVCDGKARGARDRVVRLRSNADEDDASLVVQDAPRFGQ